MENDNAALQTPPNWLTPDYDGPTPFRPQTREHLQNVAARDPRLLEIIARLEQKVEARLDQLSTNDSTRFYTRENLLSHCPEWEWVRRICRDPVKAIHAMHAEEHFDTQEETDIIRLAAYRQEHSFVGLLQQYASGVNTQGKPFTLEERRAYAETLLTIAPIAADLQPKVAVAYADTIMGAYSYFEHGKEAQALYLKLAQEHPWLVLEPRKTDPFRNFRNREEIYNTATATRHEIKEGIAAAKEAGCEPARPMRMAEQLLERNLTALEAIEKDIGYRPGVNGRG